MWGGIITRFPGWGWGLIKFSLHHIWNRVLLNTPGLKMNGHAESTPHQACSVPHPNTLIHNFTSPMEHVKTTPWSQHAYRTYIRTYIRCSISILPRTWLSPAAGWVKASLNSTKVLFQSIYNLLNNTTEWEIYTKPSTCMYLLSFNLQERNSLYMYMKDGNTRRPLGNSKTLPNDLWYIAYRYRQTARWMVVPARHTCTSD